MFQKIITNEEINKLNIIQFNGKIHLINTDNQLNEAVDFLNTQKEIGFDTESKPSFRRKQKNKVSLLQLSTETDAFLIRLNQITDYESIFSILSDSKILKIGVAIGNDFAELRKLYNFSPSSFIDLQSYVKKFNIESISLKKIGAIVLNGKISKRQQRSDWEAKEYSEAQLIYAATDAWASLMIYKKLKEAVI